MGLERGDLGDVALPRFGGGGEAEEAEGVAADDFKNIGWGEAECLEEAAGVTRKIKWEVSRTWGVDAGEGEVLKEHAEFYSVGGVARKVALLRS